MPKSKKRTDPITFQCSDPSHEGGDPNDIYRVQSHTQKLLPDGRLWVDHDGEVCSECHVLRFAEKYEWIEIEQKSGYRSPGRLKDIWHMAPREVMNQIGRSHEEEDCEHDFNDNPNQRTSL